MNNLNFNDSGLMYYKYFLFPVQTSKQNKGCQMYFSNLCFIIFLTIKAKSDSLSKHNHYLFHSLFNEHHALVFSMCVTTRKELLQQ